jgi:hypothetical protein
VKTRRARATPGNRKSAGLTSRKRDSSGANDEVPPVHPSVYPLR